MAIPLRLATHWVTLRFPLSPVVVAVESVAPPQPECWVRIALDAAPDLVIPAKVTFVADVAQFTPKTVETKAERQKLMFRVKANIDPRLLQRHVKQVKTGLPGVAYVRIDEKAAWPAKLAVRLPNE